MLEKQSNKFLSSVNASSLSRTLSAGRPEDKVRRIYEKVASIRAFEWQMFVRMYWEEVSSGVRMRCAYAGEIPYGALFGQQYVARHYTPH